MHVSLLKTIIRLYDVGRAYLVLCKTLSLLYYLLNAVFLFNYFSYALRLKKELKQA